MVGRLAERIRELKPPAPAGTGLVVLKSELIAAEMERVGLKTSKCSGRMSRDFDDEFMRGRAAGEKVSLNQGLRGSSEEPLRLFFKSTNS